MDPRVFVGMLHVGEPRLASAVRRAETQEAVQVTMSLIGDLPKWAAHEELFRRFTVMGPDFDVLVKLDADMEIVHPRLFAAVAAVFDADPGLDHIILGVDDWLSGETVQGIQFWRGGVRWDEPPPDLFTDLPASSARRGWSFIRTGIPLVVHAEDPSDLQALRYGAHRALKAANTHKSGRRHRLEAFARFAAQNPAPQRLLALAAVEAALLDEETGRELVDGTQPVRTALIEQLGERSRDVPDLLDSVLRQTAALQAVEADGSPPPSRSSLHRVAARIRSRLAAPTPDSLGSGRSEEDAGRREVLLAELKRGPVD
jgi:hypothetical protein